MFYIQIFFLVCAVLCCAGDQFEDECGLEAVASTPLVRGGLGGVKAKQFPWHVAIFHREEGDEFEQICGGSLVRSNLVISAAHCFSDRAHSHQVHVADYRIVAGVRLSSWNSNEMGRQQSEVREINLGEEYGASIRNFEDDICIIRLMTEFTFSDTVRAVCLDLVDEGLYTRQTSPGSVGKVAGWGLTEAGTFSDSLNFLRVPVVARVECIEKLPPGFKSFFTSDKICAGLTNGTAVCQGDSGGGLVFPLQNRSAGPECWFLRGVLSNAPTSRNLSDPCLANVFALYTNIYKHRIWLSIQMEDNLTPGSCRRRGSEVGICRKYADCPSAIEEAASGILPQLCLYSSPDVCCAVESKRDGVDSNCPPLPPSPVRQRKTGSKANDYCVDLAEKLFPCEQNGSSWRRGDLCGPEPEENYPQYGVFPLPKAAPSDIQRYGLGPTGRGIQVFLVSERWLLTRASLLDLLLTEPAHNITSPPEVVFSISRSEPHPQYLPGNRTIGTNDIVLVEMDSQVLFSRMYRPICMHTPQDSVGSLALSRWDYSGIRYPAALLSQEECSREFPPGSRGAAGGVTDRHTCVTSSTSSTAWCGDFWSYLTAKNGHRVACTELLVGLKLNYEKKGSTCTELYLRVAHYIPWVERVVWS